MPDRARKQGRADGLLSPQQLQPQPTRRARFGCLGYASGVLSGEEGHLNSFFSLGRACTWEGKPCLHSEQPLSGASETCGHGLVSLCSVFEVVLSLQHRQLQLLCDQRSASRAGDDRGQIWALLPFNPLSFGLQTLLMQHLLPCCFSHCSRR